MSTTEAAIVTGVDSLSVPTQDLERSVAVSGGALGLRRSVYRPERNVAQFDHRATTVTGTRRLRRRVLLRSALLAAALAAVTVGAMPARAEAGTSYCSPTGDYCHGVRTGGGVVRIMFDTLAFRGRVEVCVTDPSRERVCKRFRLRERDGMYGFTVRWSRHFPNAGPGRYRVRFRRGGVPLGPADTFRRARRTASVPAT